MDSVPSSSRTLHLWSSAGFGTSLVQRLPRYRRAGPSTSLDEWAAKAYPDYPDFTTFSPSIATISSLLTQGIDTFIPNHLLS